MLPLIYTAPAYSITFVSVIVLSRASEAIGLSWRRSQRDPTARQAIAGHSL